jgi:hypothetical protein
MIMGDFNSDCLANVTKPYKYTYLKYPEVINSTDQLYWDIRNECYDV